MANIVNPTDSAVAPTPAKRFGERAVLAFVSLTIVAVPFGMLVLFVRSQWSPLLRVDDGARDALHRYAIGHPGFVSTMRALSTIGSSPVYGPVFLLVVSWLLWRRLLRLAAFVLVTVPGSIMLNSLVKLAVDRARPVLPDPVAQAYGKSFPSGHAQSAMVTYAVLLLVFLPALQGFWRKAAYGVAVVMILAIGFSRVALGVHFVSDVVAGYLLGAAWVLAMTAAFSAWRQERGRPKVSPAQGLEPEHAEQLGPSGEPLTSRRLADTTDTVDDQRSDVR